MYSVTLIVDSPGPNPDFDPSQPISSDNQRDIIVPAGTVLTGPMAYVLCLPDAWSQVVRAEPNDEPTKAIVERNLRRRERMLSERAEKTQANAEARATKRGRRKKAG